MPCRLTASSGHHTVASIVKKSSRGPAAGSSPAALLASTLFIDKVYKNNCTDDERCVVDRGDYDVTSCMVDRE